MTLSIASAMLAALQADARSAGEQEICGILFGSNGQVTHYQAAKNVADRPSCHFEIDPAVLIAAERGAREGGDAILGYYHSHPSDITIPSAEDAANALADDRIWLIINGKEAAAWQATQHGQIFGRFDPIPLECSDA